MLSKKILVVDDDAIIVEAFEAMLGAAGYGVSIARNGEEALVKALAEKPDLILMDVMMPRGSGYETMVQIRKEPGMRDIPAIVMSGKKGWEIFFEGMSNIEFLMKPVGSKVLIDRIEHYIGKCRRHPGDPKRAILYGVDDALGGKIRDLLTRLDFQVLKALNEKEVLQLAEKFLPDIIFAQFWEDIGILDVRNIAEGLLSRPTVSGTPFYVFCLKSLGDEAVKWLKKEQIITYTETSDLLRKMEVLLKETKF